jgi:modulator of FtsH protease HflC
MQAYAKSLSSSGTTLVLKPDSDFFKYLGMDKTKPATPQP